MLIHDFIENSANIHPDRVALIHMDAQINYGELNRRANGMAQFLCRSGVEKGDRVAIIMDSSINYEISYFAVLKAGGIVVARNPVSSRIAEKGILINCTPKVIIIQAKHWHLIGDFVNELQDLETVIIDGISDKLELPSHIQPVNFPQIFAENKGQSPEVAIEPNDAGMIIYTSGTTGAPKGVVLSHKNLVANTNSIIDYLELTDKDKAMGVLPLTYAYGNSVLLTHMCVGGCVVIDNRFAFPSLILKIMAKEQVTGFAGVPSTFIILMNKSNFFNSKWDHLRYMTQAGGPMAPVTTQKILEALPQVRLFVMYGQTEASARLSYFEPALYPSKIGSIGKPIPGVTLTIRDEHGHVCPPGKTGEIVAQGDNIMTGYWLRPDETAKVLRADGLHTNDLARTDEDGFIYVVGRRDDMIKSGANRISPKEIEDIIMTHPDVQEAVVLGIPDDLLGEKIKAIIVPKDGSKISENEILKVCHKNLPLFKIPSLIEYRDSIPKSASGKVQRYLLAGKALD